MSAYVLENGKVKRKQLSDELDRLDKLIDCLADGLQQAVAAAVRDGARAAVREALAEAPVRPVATTPVAGRWAGMKAAVAAIVTVARRLVAGAVVRLQPAVAAVQSRVLGAAGKVRAVRRLAGLTWRLKRALGISLGVGAAVAMVALMDHTLASVLSGVGATAVAVAVQAGAWWRAVVRDWAAA